MLGQEVAELRSELEVTQKELRELRARTAAAAAAAAESQQQATQHAANQAVRRWKQQLASRVFGGWAENVARSRSIRIVAARVVSRMQHRSTGMALSAWRAEAARRQRFDWIRTSSSIYANPNPVWSPIVPSAGRSTCYGTRPGPIMTSHAPSAARQR